MRSPSQAAFWAGCSWQFLWALSKQGHVLLSPSVFLAQVPVYFAGTRRKSPSVPRDWQVHGYSHDG